MGPRNPGSPFPERVHGLCRAHAAPQLGTMPDVARCLAPPEEPGQNVPEPLPERDEVLTSCKLFFGKKLINLSKIILPKYWEFHTASHCDRLDKDRFQTSSLFYERLELSLTDLLPIA
jgi:hypothetical protein